MDKQMDFASVLALPEGVWKDRAFNDEELKTIQVALEIADRLKRGEISNNVLLACFHTYQDSFGSYLTRMEKAQKVITQKLLEEICNGEANRL